MLQRSSALQLQSDLNGSSDRLVLGEWVVTTTTSLSRDATADPDPTACKCCLPTTSPRERSSVKTHAWAIFRGRHSILGRPIFAERRRSARRLSVCAGEKQRAHAERRFAPFGGRLPKPARMLHHVTMQLLAAFEFGAAFSRLKFAENAFRRPIA